MNKVEETTIGRLINYWEEKLGIALDKDEVIVIKKVTYRLMDETIKRQVASAKEERERSQRFKGLGLQGGE